MFPFLDHDLPKAKELAAAIIPAAPSHLVTLRRGEKWALNKHPEVGGGGGGGGV